MSEAQTETRDLIEGYDGWLIPFPDSVTSSYQFLKRSWHANYPELFEGDEWPTYQAVFEGAAEDGQSVVLETSRQDGIEQYRAFTADKDTLQEIAVVADESNSRGTFTASFLLHLRGFGGTVDRNNNSEVLFNYLIGSPSTPRSDAQKPVPVVIDKLSAA